MRTFVVGDLQGCLQPLLTLLHRLAFDPARDTLWLTGDLVNRGSESLECLRFVRGLGERAVTVLGNHDLHLLSCALTGQRRPGDTLDAVLDAPDREELLAWLRQRPLVHYDAARGALLVHAGLAPQWSAAQAAAIGQEAQQQIAGPRGDEFLRERMYGNQPESWSDALTGWERLRFVVNCCTRLRFCDADGRMDLKAKGPPGSQPDGMLPWFAVPGRRSAGTRIVFGHWSALGRVHWPEASVYGLDCGCVWGRSLVALDLDRGAITTQPCAGDRRGGSEE